MHIRQPFRSHRDYRGFTLIELLVVIAIIGILSSIVLTALDVSRERARDGQRRSDMKSIVNALELYITDNSTYPPHGGDSYGCGSSTCLAVLTNELVDGGYISALPIDPSFGNTTDGYRYCRASTGRHYGLITQLEGTDTWCNVQHGSEPTGSACWYTNGEPNYGHCGE